MKVYLNTSAPAVVKRLSDEISRLHAALARIRSNSHACVGVHASAIDAILEQLQLARSKADGAWLLSETAKPDVTARRSDMKAASEESDTEKPLRLLVGVLSAANHSQQRTSQRNTWIQSLTQHASADIEVDVRFIVGERDCHIHPLLRLSPYDCVETPIHNPKLNVPIFSHTAAPQSGGVVVTRKLPLLPPPPVLGQEFTTYHWITLNKIGVLHAPGSSKSVTAELWDRASSQRMLQMTFDHAESRGGYLWQSISPIVLPRGFLGLLAVHGLSQAVDPNGHVRASIVDTGGGLISFGRHTFGQVTSQAPMNLLLEEGDPNADFSFAGLGFVADRSVPASVFSLPWKASVSYPKIELNQQDVLKLQFEDKDHSIEKAISKEAWTNCDLNQVWISLKSDHVFCVTFFLVD